MRSLRIQGELQTEIESLPQVGQNPVKDQTTRRTEAKGSRKPITLIGQQRSGDGRRQVFGYGMRGSLCHVNQGELPV